MEESRRRTAGPLIRARSKGIRVEIQKHCLDKIHGWCNAASSEVSGYGLCTLINGVFHVREVFLPEQFCSSDFTLIKGESFDRLQHYVDRTRVMKKFGCSFEGIPQENILNPESLDFGFWWHTHYNFKTFWSRTDDDTAQQIAEQRQNWSLSLVVNQMGDRLCRADFVDPVAITVDNLPIVEVANVGKVYKRDFSWDIKRWVKPLGEAYPKKIAVWNSSGIKLSDKEPIRMGTKYIVYGGKLITLQQYALMLEHECGDLECSNCKEAIRAAL